MECLNPSKNVELRLCLRVVEYMWCESRRGIAILGDKGDLQEQSKGDMRASQRRECKDAAVNPIMLY